LEIQSNVWLEAVRKHLVLLEERFAPDSWGTVYVGGGTPTVLPPATLTALLESIACGKTGGGKGPRELTVEMNPENATAEILDRLCDGGVTRLSVGVQSFEENARTIAARRGDAMSVKRQLESIARSWKGKLSVDMMYGLPGQTVDGIRTDIRFLSDLGAGHVSLYELTLEEGTPLWGDARAGLVGMPDEDLCADQFDAAAGVLKKAGFERYEVSNWAKSGQECMHNGVYWSMGDWFALGPSGVGNVSMPDGSYLRIENSRDDGGYYRDPVATVVETLIDGIDAEFECLMTSLRTRMGFDPYAFRMRFGIDACDVFGNLPHEFPDMILDVSGPWRATDKGLDMLNAVLVYGLAQAEKFHAGRTMQKGVSIV
jgi:oxygen-independent coproporphyrinogen-3 oxidase